MALSACTLGLSGCAAENAEPSSSASDLPTLRTFPQIESLVGKPTGEIAALDTTNATCVGQFRFDSEYSGRGHSECTRGAGVDFTASSAETVAVDLVCNYTLVYDYGVEPQHGTGDIACDDGTVGTLAFGLTSPQGGEAVATLRDGRVLKFTYTYIYL